MTTPTYVSPFTGTVVQPTDVSYLALNFSSNTSLYWPAVVNGTQVAAARIINATASTSGLSIYLPEADQGTVGSDILIRNLGSTAFTVNSFGQDSAVSVAAGTSKYFYLTDNSTPDGVWSNVTFGTGTSTADAASLAGYGLATTLSGKLATSNIISQVSSNLFLTASSQATTYIWTSGVGTFTLPTYASIPTGWYFGFNNNGTGALTIVPQGTATINGLSSVVINPGGSGIVIYDSNSGNFFTVGWAVPNNVTFSAATYNVDTISGSTLNLVSNAPIIQTYESVPGTRSTNLYVTLPAITQLYVFISTISSLAYNVIINVSGSTSPPFVLTSGAVVIAGTDGGTVFPISQTSSIANLIAANGSATAPSFSFTNSLNTGMYLASAGVLGLTANGIQLLNLNGSNTGNLQLSTTATFTATGGIAGGTF